MGPSQVSSIHSHSIGSPFVHEVTGTNVVPIRKFATQPIAEWRGTAKERLEELMQLKLGWDGYRGVAVSSSNAHFALSMLESICGIHTPAPQIVPGSSGDLQVEWHTLRGDIELHVKAPNVVSAWRLIPNGDPDGEEIDLTNDFAIVGKWVKEMTEPVIAARAATA